MGESVRWNGGADDAVGGSVEGAQLGCSLDAVGAAVDALGATVGISLGATVGIVVGYSVGTSVGAAVGTEVGTLAVVGARVGCALPVVGTSVLGLADGGPLELIDMGWNTLGRPVGDTMGDCDGAGFGPSVDGLTVGLNEGEPLGREVGSVLVQLQDTWKSNQPKGPLPEPAALYSST